jgi:hypothetical protein
MNLNKQHTKSQGRGRGLPREPNPYLHEIPSSSLIERAMAAYRRRFPGADEPARNACDVVQRDGRRLVVLANATRTLARYGLRMRSSRRDGELRLIDDWVSGT